MKRRNRDVVIGGILAVFSCVYLAMSLQIKLTNIDRIVGSRLFPQICGVVVLLLSIWMILNGVRSRQTVDATREQEKKSYTRTVIVLGSYAAYIFLMDKIGFTLASVLYLFSQMIAMGKWNLRKKTVIWYLAISISVSLAVYVMFNKVFMLMLPKAGWF